MKRVRIYDEGTVTLLSRRVVSGCPRAVEERRKGVYSPSILVPVVHHGTVKIKPPFFGNRESTEVGSYDLGLSSRRHRSQFKDRRTPVDTLRPGSRGDVKDGSRVLSWCR